MHTHKEFGRQVNPAIVERGRHDLIVLKAEVERSFHPDRKPAVLVVFPSKHEEHPGYDPAA